jgi:hypothetical protein
MRLIIAALFAPVLVAIVGCRTNAKVEKPSAEPDSAATFAARAVSDAQGSPSALSQEAIPLASERTLSKESEADSGTTGPRPQVVAVPAPHPPALSPTTHKRGEPCPRGHQVWVPLIRLEDVRASGSLSPDDIERVVRQNFGRFRLCFELGMRDHPSLQGRVALKLLVSASGASLPIEERSNMTDSSTIACIVRGIRNLAFPSAQAGTAGGFSLTLSPRPPDPPCAPNAEPISPNERGRL